MSLKADINYGNNKTFTMFYGPLFEKSRKSYKFSLRRLENINPVHLKRSKKNNSFSIKL